MRCHTGCACRSVHAVEMSMTAQLEVHRQACLPCCHDATLFS